MRNPLCWCQPTARATAGRGDVVLLVATRDTGDLPGVSISDDGTWMSLSAWTPRQARVLASQLLAAADQAEAQTRRQ